MTLATKTALALAAAIVAVAVMYWRNGDSIARAHNARLPDWAIAAATAVATPSATGPDAVTTQYLMPPETSVDNMGTRLPRWDGYRVGDVRRWRLLGEQGRDLYVRTLSLRPLVFEIAGGNVDPSPALVAAVARLPLSLVEHGEALQAVRHGGDGFYAAPVVDGSAALTLLVYPSPEQHGTSASAALNAAKPGSLLANALDPVKRLRKTCLCIVPAAALAKKDEKKKTSPATSTFFAEAAGTDGDLRAVNARCRRQLAAAAAFDPADVLSAGGGNAAAFHRDAIARQLAECGAVRFRPGFLPDAWLARAAGAARRLLGGERLAGRFALWPDFAAVEPSGADDRGGRVDILPPPTSPFTADEMLRPIVRGPLGTVLAAALGPTPLLDFVSVLVAANHDVCHGGGGSDNNGDRDRVNDHQRWHVDSPRRGVLKIQIALMPLAAANGHGMIELAPACFVVPRSGGRPGVDPTPGCSRSPPAPDPWPALTFTPATMEQGEAIVYASSLLHRGRHHVNATASKLVLDLNVVGMDTFRADAPPSWCRDLHDSCEGWAQLGECTANPEWMEAECARSCGTCTCPEGCSGDGTVRNWPQQSRDVNAKHKEAWARYFLGEKFDGD